MREIGSMVNEYGNDGLCERERCVDLPIGIGVRGKAYVQVVNFNDGERHLALRWFDDGGRHFCDDYEKVSETIRNVVEYYLQTLK